MKRRRFDSDSDDEGNATAASVAQPAASSVAAAAPVLVAPTSAFGEGTLFSKGKRTQLASDLVSRPDADWSALGMVGAHTHSANTDADDFHSAFGVGTKNSSSEPKMSLLEELEGYGTNNTPPRQHGSMLRGYDASFEGVTELLPLASSAPHQFPTTGHAAGGQSPTPVHPSLSTSLSLPPPPLSSTVANLLPSGIVGVQAAQQQQQPAHRIAIGGVAAAAVAARQIPVGLSSIKGYVAKGMRPQMNCRIQDDESGRTGVWLPPSTVLQSTVAPSSTPADAGPSGTAAATVSTTSPNTTVPVPSSANKASTMLCVRPLKSDRLRPLLAATLASTGPISVDVLRSLKSAPMPEDKEKRKRRRRREVGGADDGESSGDEKEEPVEEGGAKGGRGGHRSEGGRGGFGRGGRGGVNNANAPSTFVPFDERKDVVRHIDVGGGGLQHPYFNGYCSTVLRNVTLTFDAGLPEGVAPILTSPTTSNAAAASSMAFPSAGGAAGLTEGTTQKAMSADTIVPTLTVLSHSLCTRDVVSMYCGGTAAKTARPTKAEELKKAGGTASPTTAGIAHSSATKPHEYMSHPQLSANSTILRSGWRWDGIVRGNPRILAKYMAYVD